MEHLSSKLDSKTCSHLSTLVGAAINIQEGLKTAVGRESVLLWIELQAVVQVLIQQLALHLDPSQTSKLGDVESNLKDINK